MRRWITGAAAFPSQSHTDITDHVVSRPLPKHPYAKGGGWKIVTGVMALAEVTTQCAVTPAGGETILTPPRVVQVTKKSENHTIVR